MVYLRRCKLESVPTVVEQLDKLCILDLTDNQIRDEGLPMSLARLTQLKAIGLKKNCLTRVPRMLGYMQSLQEIYLEENAELEVCSLGTIALVPNICFLARLWSCRAWCSKLSLSRHCGGAACHSSISDDCVGPWHE